MDYGSFWLGLFIGYVGGWVTTIVYVAYRRVGGGLH